MCNILKEINMRTMGSFIRNSMPKFNKIVTEGMTYHRLKNAVEYLDAWFHYTVKGKTKTHLQYLGYKEVGYLDECKRLIGKNQKTVYDCGQNSIYLVDFIFRYGSEPTERVCSFYVPYADRGNIIYFSDNAFLAMPVLADKVVSIGENVVFINVSTAKYNFNRFYYTVLVNGRFTRTPIIHTVLYKNQKKKVPDTTKANTTVIHYLLAQHGYSKLANEILGFVPEPTYDPDTSRPGIVVIEPTGLKPNGYIRDKKNYVKSNIKFLVPENCMSEQVSYFLGNIFYVLDNFPEFINIGDLDSSFLWKRLLGEIIHSGNHQVSYIMEKMSAHFSDLNSHFDLSTVNKLRDIGIHKVSLIDLMSVIFNEYNHWMLSEEVKTLYGNKTLEVESYLLAPITHLMVKCVLDLAKEENREGGKELDPAKVTSCFERKIAQRAIFSLKKLPYVEAVGDSTDCLLSKKVTRAYYQEADPVSIDGRTGNQNKRKLTAAMSTAGNILALPKADPQPLARINPWINIDPISGTVLPPTRGLDIIIETDKMLQSSVADDSFAYDENNMLNPDDLDNEDYGEEYLCYEEVVCADEFE